MLAGGHGSRALVHAHALVAMPKEILDAILLLAKTEGIFTEPAGGVSISVLQKMVEQGKIDANDKVVCYVTGNGLKATESIMEVLQKPAVMKADIEEISAVVN